MGTVENIRRVPVMEHIAYRVRKLEKACNGVACLQFADHPKGLSMVVRIYIPASEKEFVYPTVITEKERITISENESVDLLFDVIHDALDSIQIVPSIHGSTIVHK